MSAAEADSSGEIVIKGGSCEIHFDDSLFKKDSSDPKKLKHKHDKLMIKQIVIDGNTTLYPVVIDGKTMLDSGEIAGGFKGEIRIKYYKPKS